MELRLFSRADAASGWLVKDGIRGGNGKGAVQLLILFEWTNVQPMAPRSGSAGIHPRGTALATLS